MAFELELLIASITVTAAGFIVWYAARRSLGKQKLIINPPTGEGKTNPAAGTYFFYKGQATKIEAVPTAVSKFVCWEVDGLKYHTPIIKVLMQQDHSVTANFEGKSEVSQ
jgi:hypothetical protein